MRAPRCHEQNPSIFPSVVTDMTRWKAAGTHFGLSILIIGGIALSAFLLWYPLGLYKVAGLDRLLLVMLGIDLTAGPLLTLILYRPAKKGLKFDLTFVALAQLAFLAYGLNTLWLSRPVFLVGTPEVFTLVFASEIDKEDLELAPKPEWRRLSWNGPQLVGTRMPADPTERRAVIEKFMAGGAGIERSPGHYRELSELAPDIVRNSRRLDTEPSLAGKDIRKTGRARGDLRILPIVSRRGEGTMLLDSRTGEPLHTVGGKNLPSQEPPRETGG